MFYWMVKKVTFKDNELDMNDLCEVDREKRKICFRY